MIGGLVEHDGHIALAIHLAKAGDNETIRVETHGLGSETIADALDELRFMAMGCRSKKPLLHVWASASTHYSEQDWHRHRDAFETEFGLQGFPCIEVTHRKLGAGGRTSEHKHLVYLRIDVHGKAVRTSHSAARMEKVSRIAEVRNGERLTSGRFNDSIIDHLRRDGLDDVADGMVRAGLAGTKAKPAPTSSERAMTERLKDLAADEVWRRAASAWHRCDSGNAFRAALAEAGLRLALGETCAVVVTGMGAVYPLLRAINKGGERANGASLRKAEMAARIKGLDIPAVAALPPIAPSDAGVFAITGLDRIPMPQPMADEPQDNDVSGLLPTAIEPAQGAAEAGPQLGVETPSTVAPRILTREQLEALVALEDTFCFGTRERVSKIRAEIERQVIAEIAERRNAETRQRLENEVKRWKLPGLGEAGWRKRYKAELAGLPHEYGAILKWVDARDAERKRVVLKSGVVIDLAPTVAVASASAADTIDVIIAHATGRKWSRVSVTEGDREWRERTAIAATRAGLVVTNKDLAEIVQVEQERLACELLVEQWRVARHIVFDGDVPTSQDQKRIFVDLLAVIDEQASLWETMAMSPMGPQLEDDLAQLRRYRELDAAPTPKPGR